MKLPDLIHLVQKVQIQTADLKKDSHQLQLMHISLPTVTVQLNKKMLDTKAYGIPQQSSVLQVLV